MLSINLMFLTNFIYYTIAKHLSYVKRLYSRHTPGLHPYK